MLVYVVALIGAGVWAGRLSRRKGNAESTKGYFLAGRHMPVWAVTISTLATAQSAATFVAVPQDAYDGSLVYLSASIGSVLAGFILAVVFIPAYYRLGVSTPYQVLEKRFGNRARVATSVAYLFGRVFASGARLYIGAIPLTIALFGERTPSSLAVVLLAFTIFAILFTLRGGLESVIWTDVLQVCVYLGAGVAVLVFLWYSIPGSAGDVFKALSTGRSDGGSKLAIIDPGIDTSQSPWINFAAPFTLLTAVTGWTLLNLAALGTDQDLAQRLLTCKDAKSGARSAIASTLVGLPAVALFACIGLLLWVFCTQSQLMGRPTPEYVQGNTADMFMRVVLNEMPAWLVGLVLAGVLAAGPAGHNATLNSMASTLIADVYRPLRAGRSEAHYLFVGRWMVVGCGVILCVFAVLCAIWQAKSGENLISFVLGVMGFAYAGLLGVFLTALLTNRGTATSAIAAMITGFVVVLLLQPLVIKPVMGAVFGVVRGAELAQTFTLASPWRLCIGVACACAVCMLPRGKAKDSLMKSTRG